MNYSTLVPTDHVNFVSDQTSSTSHGTGSNLPNLGVLLNEPVVMGVGDKPVTDISSAAVTHLQPGAHIDHFGEHGHTGKDPVIHTPDGQFHQIESPFGATHPKPDAHQHDHLHATDNLAGAHVEHTAELPGVVNLDTGAHIDFAKEHNNPYDCAVMHTPDGQRTPINCPQSKPAPITGPGHHQFQDTTVLIDTHVPNKGTIIADPHPHSVPTLPGVTHLDTGDHIDFHGEHDNFSGKTVLHKKNGRRIPMDAGLGQANTNAGVPNLPPGAHVDFHGQHNNPHKDPVVHLPSGKHVHLSTDKGHASHTTVVDPGPLISDVPHIDIGGVDPHMGHMDKLPGAELPPGAHIDFHGQHNNKHKDPVVHLPSGKHVHLSTDKGHGSHSTVVDPGLPIKDVPHIDTSGVDPHIGHIDKLPGVAELPPGAHIDFHGQHNNKHKDPVVHLPSGKHVHLSTDKGHGSHSTVVDPGLPINDVPHIDMGGVGSHMGHMDKLPGAELPPGAHIDFHGQHNNKHKDPVVHLPSGKHVHLSTDKGHGSHTTVVDPGPLISDVPHIDIGGVDPHMGHMDKLPGVVAELPPGVVDSGLPIKDVPHMGGIDQYAGRVENVPADQNIVGRVDPGINPDFPVAPFPETYLQDAFPRMEVPLAHEQSDFPPLKTPGSHAKPEFPLPGRNPAILKPDILPVDAIPDLFGAETSFVPRTEDIPPSEIAPEVPIAIKTGLPKRTLGKIISKQIERRRQQQIEKLERYGSRPGGKLRGPSRKPGGLPPLRPRPPVKPHRKQILGGLVKNMFRQMYGRRGPGKKRGHVKPVRRGRGRGRPVVRRRRRRFGPPRPRQRRRGGRRFRRFSRD